MNNLLERIMDPIVNRTLDLLEWLYDHDVKSRKSKPFGG